MTRVNRTSTTSVTVGCLVAALAAIVAASPLRAELLSKRYLFRTGAVLQIGKATSDGLRLDDVRFVLTGGGMTDEGRPRPGGSLEADVAVSNVSEAPRRVGVAIALFDDADRLLAVASSGTQFGSIKPGRQKRFKLNFDDVNLEAYRATEFQVSLESKP